MLGNNDNPFAALGAAQTPLACNDVQRFPAEADNLADRTLLIHATEPQAALADVDALSDKFGDSERVLFGQTIAWTPTRDDANEIDREFTDLEKHGRRVQVLRGGEPLSLMLRATAPEPSAAFIEQELASFSACPAWLNVLPPWSKEWTQSADLARWRKMRTLLKAVLEIPSETYANQDQALWKDRADAARRRDNKRVAEIDKRMSEARAKQAETKLSEFKKTYDDADSQRLIAAATPYVLAMFATLNEDDFAEPEKKGLSPGEQSLADVRDLLGAQLDEPVRPPSGDGEAPSGISAWASRDGQTLNLNLSIPRLGTRLVEFVAWLCEHDCSQLHYDVWGLTNDLGNLEGFEDFEE
jgi:hypothetical protein